MRRLAFIRCQFSSSTIDLWSATLVATNALYKDYKSLAAFLQRRDFRNLVSTPRFGVPIHDELVLAQRTSNRAYTTEASGSRTSVILKRQSRLQAFGVQARYKRTWRARLDIVRMDSLKIFWDFGYLPREVIHARLPDLALAI